MLGQLVTERFGMDDDIVLSLCGQHTLGGCSDAACMAGFQVGTLSTTDVGALLVQPSKSNRVSPSAKPR